jgi:hypothetical protein
LGGLAMLAYFTAGDIMNDIIGTFVGLVISYSALYFLKIFVGYLEDVLKINYNTEDLLGIYNGDENYRKELVAADKKGKKTIARFAYADIFVNRDKLLVTQFSVEDDPQKELKLDEFIEGNYATLFSAHSNSVKKNFDTIRLDRYDPDEKKFYLSRSTYFNHLVTNRAVDFFIFDDVSLRTIYEYGPLLTPLENSKMSNHVGINALVFLSDGKLLIPRRGGSATISKNKVTSSVAIMLNLPKDEADKKRKINPKDKKITAEYLLRDNIVQTLPERVKLLPKVFREAKPEIEFLGFGQNIYEGGKPQFYFSVKLDNVSSKNYFELHKDYKREQKRELKHNKNKKKIDQDKCMYVADLGSFHYGKDCVKFTAYNKRNKPFKVKAGYEMSYLCNLWHYQQCNPTPKSGK